MDGKAQRLRVKQTWSFLGQLATLLQPVGVLDVHGLLDVQCGLLYMEYGPRRRKLRLGRLRESGSRGLAGFGMRGSDVIT